MIGKRSLVLILAVEGEGEEGCVVCMAKVYYYALVINVKGTYMTIIVHDSY